MADTSKRARSEPAGGREAAWLLLDAAARLHPSRPWWWITGTMHIGDPDAVIMVGIRRSRSRLARDARKARAWGADVTLDEAAGLAVDALAGTVAGSRRYSSYFAPEGPSPPLAVRRGAVHLLAQSAGVYEERLHVWTHPSVSEVTELIGPISLEDSRGLAERALAEAVTAAAGRRAARAAA